MAYHESCEAYLAEYFQDVNLAAIHAGKVTIKDKDFAFVRSIRHKTYFSIQVPQKALTMHMRDWRETGIRIQQV
jgi:hypothetical protein